MNYFLVTTLFLAQTTEPVGVPVGVPIVIGVILLLLFWWGLNRNSIPQGATGHEDAHEGDDHDPQSQNEPHGVSLEDGRPAVEEASKTATISLAETAVFPDDLKIIEGIGPKIEGILHDSGIKTFAELAAASVSQLEKIVRKDAGIRIAFPDTWPEQAKLAAAGDWTALETLQDELKGGRRS
jgi:predicted flap endonuclease-1-like 5' DNA nuclease